MQTHIKSIMASIFLAISIHSIADTNNVVAKVERVIDGDTLVISQQSTTNILRLKDIDCPEKKQPAGIEAKMFVERLVLGKEISFTYSTNDRYGRMIADITMTNGISLNEEIVRNGWGYWYKQYSTNQHILFLEDYARSNKLGMWQSTNGIPPWEWRRSHR